MRVLVTGGAGFIGSHLARRLMAKGDEVIVADNLSTGGKANIPAGASFIDVDLSRPDSIAALPSNVQAVCHLAAQSAGSVSAEKPYYDLQANAGSTMLLTRWCLKQGIRRFVFASSMAAYGQVLQSPVREDAHCVPLSYYGLSKLTSEHFLRLCAREGLRVTSLRMFTTYGPGQDLDNVKQGMVKIFLSYLLKGVPVPVTGSLERFRDLIHIDDLIDAWERTVAMPDTPSPVYNIAAGKPTTVRELLAALKRALDLPEDYPVQELPGTASDQFGLYADISKARTELGFEPRVGLDQGLRQMAAWARKRITPEVRTDDL